ncbi:MAG: tRNA (guanosine(46)-N7)-methyltransferase TrmB [Alphaproteobacteria bacterium]
MTHPLIKSFGRRIAKPLSQSKKDKLQNLLPKILISKNPTRQLLNLFPEKVSKICLDIGFGSGENLIQKVIENPTIGFIGSEVFQNGIVAFLTHWENANCPQNILIYNDDVRELVQNFPDDSIDIIDLFYPDPWHKKRHHKRRMIVDSTLDLFAKKLKKGGEIRLVSDIENYIENAQENFEKHQQFEIVSLSKKAFENWTSTRYEQKAIRENRSPQYMKIIKL